MEKLKNEQKVLVKIFWFDRTKTESAEAELGQLLAQGWHIIASGGTGGGGGVWGGYLVLRYGQENS